MKKLYKITKRTSFIAAALFLGLTQLWAQSPIGMVHEVRGNVFMTHLGKTLQLRAGAHIYDFAEIFTEAGSQVTVSDYFDHQFHLSGSGHIRFLNKIVEVKSGYLWFQSLSNANGHFYIQTANAQVDYELGEGIVSFDSVGGKTQFLAVNGHFTLANILEPERFVEISDGQFSFVKKDYSNGIPRKPTPIGFSSYKKVTALFHSIAPLNKRAINNIRLGDSDPEEKRMAKAPTAQVSQHDSAFEKALSQKKPSGQRSIASTNENNGRTVFIRREANPIQREAQANRMINYHKGKVQDLNRPRPKKKFRPESEYVGKSNVKINIFGQDRADVKYEYVHKRVVQEESAPRRVPASLNELKAPAAVHRPQIFENRLVDEYKKQMRHSNEVNQLIDELKSYDMDYKKSY